MRALLERLADADQPPSRVDIARACRDGRNKLRRRLLMILGISSVAVAAAVALIGVGTVSLPPAGHHGSGSPATGRGSAQPGPGTPTPTVASGLPTPRGYAGAGHQYLRPGFVRERLVSSAPSRLVLQAPPGVAPRTLPGAPP